MVYIPGKWLVDWSARQFKQLTTLLIQEVRNNIDFYDVWMWYEWVNLEFGRSLYIKMHILTNLSSVFMCAGCIVGEDCVHINLIIHVYEWVEMEQIGILVSCCRSLYMKLEWCIIFRWNVYIVRTVGMKCI